MIRIPVKIIQQIVKHGSKEVDMASPVALDTVEFFVTVAKEIIKPW